MEILNNMEIYSIMQEVNYALHSNLEKHIEDNNILRNMVDTTSFNIR